MINRVLIRTKVVQLLYSYLLTRSEFKINEAPATTSRDKKYAHSLYIDFILLLLELSGYSVKHGVTPHNIRIEPKIANNKVAKALSQNIEIKSIISKDTTQVTRFDGILQQLADRIAKSKVFIDYAKKRSTTLSDDVTLWIVTFEPIIAKSPELIDMLRESGEYSSQGFHWAIRDVCSTLRDYVDTSEFFAKAKKDLTVSLDKAYELYLRLLSLIIDITVEQERRIEAAKSKHLASSEDLNPNTKLIDNKLIPYLQNIESFTERCDEYHVLPSEDTSTLVKGLLDKILASDIYADYINAESSSFVEDVEFWRDVMRTIILPSDLLEEELEEQSVYWNDDLQIMGTFTLKTLRQISTANGEALEILPKYKDLEDEEFGPQLFIFVATNQEEYRRYIDMFVQKSHWDTERLAFMDIVIMTTAIAEILNFPAIPVPVSVNEYVEIANNYSTDKSGGFVNGILYSVSKYFREHGMINKE